MKTNKPEEKKIRCNNCYSIYAEDKDNSVTECFKCKTDQYLMEIELKCEGVDHNPNPGKIVKGGGRCVECGFLVPDESVERSDGTTVGSHTPTPWITDHQDIGSMALGHGKYIQVGKIIDKADAEFIVRAVNSYPTYEALLSFAQAYVNGINLPISAVKQVLKQAEGTL